MHFRAIGVAIVVSAVLTTAIAKADVVYEQDALLGGSMITPAQGLNAAESSTPDGKATTGFYGSSVADNFTLAKTTTLTNLAWTGFIENYNTATNSNISGFSVQFFAPGVDPYNFSASIPLFSEDFSLAASNPVAIENPNPYGTTTYSFDVNLGSAPAGQTLTFNAGQEYFVAINADIIDPNSSSYFWSAGTRTTPDVNPQTIAIDGHTPTNGYSYDVEWNGQFADPSIGWPGISGLNDLAFTLSDASSPAVAVAPLPGVAWAALPLIGLLAAMRFRRPRRV